MNKGKRAASEGMGRLQKKIKLEEDNQTATFEIGTNVAKTLNPNQKNKSQSEPPSLKKLTKIPSNFAIKKSQRTKPATFWHRPFRRNDVLRRASFSQSFSSRSRNPATPSCSSDAATQNEGNNCRMNKVAKSIQSFNTIRAASAPILSSTASQQGSTPTVKYVGPPDRLVRSAVQQQQPPVPPSASSSVANARSRTSANNQSDQAGSSILMRIEWASIDNPFLCGGHPILLQGKGTIPEMMNAIKTQVTKFENSLKKKLAKSK